MKVARADANDLRGIASVHKASGIDPAILVDRFCSEMSHAASSMQKLCLNLLYVVQEIFGAAAASEAEARLRARLPEVFR
jgi:hypothetical protein